VLNLRFKGILFSLASLGGLQYFITSGLAFLTGYPTSRLLFTESHWRRIPKHEKGIYSALSGGALAAILYFIIVAFEAFFPQTNSVLEGQEMSLVLPLLLIIAWIEVIIIAIKQRRRKGILVYL
jgi:hypothetical protein